MSLLVLKNLITLPGGRIINLDLVALVAAPTSGLWKGQKNKICLFSSSDVRIELFDTDAIHFLNCLKLMGVSVDELFRNMELANKELSKC